MHRGLKRGLKLLWVCAVLVTSVSAIATDVLVPPVYLVAADVLTPSALQPEIEVMRLRQQVAELEQKLNASCKGRPRRDPSIKEPVWAGSHE
jgi:hypothetical protein